MDSLANYGHYDSDGDNSSNSDEPKMKQKEDSVQGRACDANYDPVQMDMSEESNENNTSNGSDSERPNTPLVPATTDLKTEKRKSPTDQRRPEHEEQRRERRGRRSSRDRRHRDSRRPRDGERRSSRDDRRDKANDDKDKEHNHRDERRDRDRDRGDRRRERERRSHFRDDRGQKERHRDDRPSHHKEKDSQRPRSRSRERNAPYRPSYREEKGRNKLAQLEKLGIELKAPDDAALVPGEQHFYNPLATATQGKYAEQIKKRKLLWANKSKEDGKPTNSTTSTWVGTTFTHDQDGKVSAKFKRLMGIKEDLPAPQVASGAKPEILKKQEEMFNNMEQQYEVARATTHTQRGVGLGYATSGYQFPR